MSRGLHRGCPGRQSQSIDVLEGQKRYGNPNVAFWNWGLLGRAIPRLPNDCYRPVGLCIERCCLRVLIPFFGAKGQINDAIGVKIVSVATSKGRLAPGHIPRHC